MIRFHSLVVSSYRLAMLLLYYFVRFCAISIFQTRPKNKVNFVAGSWFFSAVSLYLRNPCTGMCVSSYFLIIQLQKREVSRGHFLWSWRVKRGPRPVLFCAVPRRHIKFEKRFSVFLPYKKNKIVSLFKTFPAERAII